MEPSLNADIRDIKPPLDWPSHFFWPWGVLILIATITVLILGLWIQARRRAHVIPQTPRTPAEVAFILLSGLEQRPYHTPEQAKEFYIELADIVRRYIEERFSVRAPQMSTEEFLIHLKTAANLNASQKDILKDFLSACDMVKFARYGPSEQEAKESILLAKKLIDETGA